MSSKPVDTAIVMVVGPLVDDTDFKSLEEAIAYNAAGMDISLIVEKTDGTSAVTVITLTTGGTSDWTHKDGGYYEVEITAAQNTEEGIAYLRGVCTGVLPFESAHYDIVKANIYDSLIKGTDVLQVDVTQLLGTAWLAPGVAGTPDVNAKLIGSTAQTGRDIGASVLLSTGTGAGQLDFTSGIVKSNLTQILSHLLTQTDTQLADGFEHFFDVATPTGTLDSLPAVAPNAAGGLPVSAAGGLDLDAVLSGNTPQTADNNTILAHADYGLAELVRSTTPANKLDVSATGEAGLDFANIKNATGVHTLTNITVPTVSTLTNKSGFALSAAGADLILKDSTFALAMADAIWDEILTGATHNIASSAGRRVREIGAFAIHSGTATAGSGFSITIAASASADDGVYNRNLIVLVDNTGAGQTRTIVDYDASSKICVVDREWRVSPDATTEYQIVPDDTPLTVDHGRARGGTATTITLRTYASAIDDTYLCNQIGIIAGPGRGQVRLVGAYDGTSKIVTICGDDWVTTPTVDSIYVMMPYGTTCASCIGDYALGLINTECDTALTDYDPPTRTEATTDKDAIITEVNVNETKIDALQTDSTAVKAKTDNLPSGIGKNEALAKFDVFMVLSSDHVTGATGKTVAGTISKDGGAFAAITNVITEVSDGMYTIASGFPQAEMNADVLTLKFTADGCDTRIITIHTS